MLFTGIASRSSTRPTSFWTNGSAYFTPANKPVERCHGFEALADFFLQGEVGGTGLLVFILRLVGHQGLKAPLEVVGDVHDEGWANVVVERGVNDLEGTMRREFRDRARDRRRFGGARCNRSVWPSLVSPARKQAS